MTETSVANRSTGAKSRRMRYLTKQLDGVLRAFHNATCDPEAPLQHLSYTSWSPIDSRLALPPSAHVDWQRGVAKVPAEWELTLDASKFCFLDAERNATFTMLDSEIFQLEDMRADMTISTITNHITRWLRRDDAPSLCGAEAIAGKEVRLARKRPLQRCGTARRRQMAPTQQRMAPTTRRAVQGDCSRQRCTLETSALCRCHRWPSHAHEGRRTLYVTTATTCAATAATAAAHTATIAANTKLRCRS